MHPLSAPQPVVLGYREVTEVMGPQGQALTPIITREVTGSVGLSGGSVRMPPGGISRSHLHAHSEIIVAVLAGEAATVVWGRSGPEVLRHTVGEMCYVPAGVPHCAINLSQDSPVFAYEFRTDPTFNSDVVLLPELEPEIEKLATRLHHS